MEASIFIAAANKNSNQYKYSPDKLKILASFLLIDDLNIRSYFDTAYYSGIDLLVKSKKGDSFKCVFLLNFILIPFLHMFIKKNLSLLIPPTFTGAPEKPILKGKLEKLRKKDFLCGLVKNPNRSNLTRFRKKLDYIEQCEHSESIYKYFTELYFKVGNMKDRTNSGKKRGQSFNQLLTTEPLKWYKNNRGKNNRDKFMRNIGGAIEYLAGEMADDFEDVIGMNSNSFDSKITLEKLIDDLDSYFKRLNNAEEVKMSQDKLLRELNKRGWI